MIHDMVTFTKTIARWMQPPNKKFHSAQEYQGCIDVRVPAKENSCRQDNANSHFYAARVRYVMELASKYSTSTIVLSVGNKNKILLGDNVAAVDRHIQINRFFLVTDHPNHSDHDFPVPGYYIVPSGYLQMKPPESPQITKDHLGREQFV